MPMSDKFEFEFIDEGAMEFVARGRKSEVSPALVNALKSMPKGKAVKLTALRIDLKADNAKTEKARVGATIRKAASLAGVKVGIRWATDGTPQAVRV